MPSKIKGPFFLMLMVTILITTGCENLFSPVQVPQAPPDLSNTTNTKSTSRGISNIKKGIDTLKLSVTEETSQKIIIINGNVGYSTRAIINGKEIPVDYNGNFSTSYKLKPGKNEIIMDVYNKRGNLVGTLSKTVTFTPLPPELSVAAPENTEIEPVAVTGMTEPDCTVLVNGIKTMVDAKGKFSRYIGLKAGDNTIEVISTNKFGKSTAEQKIITFNPPLPKLSVNIPAYSSQEKITLNGLTDPQTLIEVFINDTNWDQEYASLAFKGITGEDGKFTADIKLSEGDNTVTVIVTNRYEKQTTFSQNINFKVGPPKLYVVPIEQSTTEYVEISGFTDENSSVIVYANGVKAMVNVHNNGKFSARVHIDKDAIYNDILIVAQNKWGYTSEETLSIEYIGK